MLIPSRTCTKYQQTCSCGQCSCSFLCYFIISSHITLNGLDTLSFLLNFLYSLESLYHRNRFSASFPPFLSFLYFRNAVLFLYMANTFFFWDDIIMHHHISFSLPLTLHIFQTFQQRHQLPFALKNHHGLSDSFVHA